jgi:hypothetical protein
MDTNGTTRATPTLVLVMKAILSGIAAYRRRADAVQRTGA